MKTNELSSKNLLREVYFEIECYNKEKKEYVNTRFYGNIVSMSFSVQHGAYGYICVFENCYQKKINFIIKDKIEFKSLIGEDLKSLQFKN